MGSVVLAPEIRQSTACVIFTDQGSGSMHWQADSYSWYHQGNPRSMNFESKFKKGLKIYFRKKCGKNTQNNYTKKIFMTQIITVVCMITHLEPDILECEVKWVLESITMNKASGSDGIPVELFQILKDDAVKVIHSICQQIWKTQLWPQD